MNIYKFLMDRVGDYIKTINLHIILKRKLDAENYEVSVKRKFLGKNKLLDSVLKSISNYKKIIIYQENNNLNFTVDFTIILTEKINKYTIRDLISEITCIRKIKYDDMVDFKMKQNGIITTKFTTPFKLLNDIEKNYEISKVLMYLNRHDDYFRIEMENK